MAKDGYNIQQESAYPISSSAALSTAEHKTW